MYFSLDRHLPPLAKLGCWLMCTTWRHNPDLYFRSQINGLRNSQEAQTWLPRLKAMMTADFLEAVRTGTQGVTWDLELLARPWGFHLHVITTDVFLWHGESDTQAPLVMGKRLASAIPHCRATFFPKEGHWAIYSHWQEILTALVQSEGATREGPQLAAIAVTTQNNNSGTETVFLPECSDMAIVDTPADSSQGLQPAREAAEVVPTESAEGSTTILPVTPASVSPEAETVQEAPKPVSKKTARRRAAATANTLASVSPEPERAQETPKPVSKKTAGRRTAATADSPTKASDKMKPAPEKPKSAAGRTARRSVAATADARTDDSSQPKPRPDKEKITAKRPAKPRAAVIEPLYVGTPEGPHPAQKPAEPTSKKPSSGRKAVKEAVLV
jgi:hypothetical protein